MAAWALLFSFMAPGAGQIFVGEFAQGVMFGALFALGKSALLPLSLRVFKVTQLKRTLQFFYVCNWCYIVLILVAAGSAYWQALHAQKTYALAACVSVLCVRLAKKQTYRNFIFTALCGRTGVFALLQKMAPAQTVKK